MKIQVTSSNNLSFETKHEIVNSTLNKPMALDSFDINIFSLQNDKLWAFDENISNKIYCTNDLISIKRMIETSQSSINIVALPQNYTHYYDYWEHKKRYDKKIELKNELTNLRKNLLASIIPDSFTNSYELIYENSETFLNGKSYISAFCFVRDSDVLTRSKGGNKATTLQFGNLIITTLDLKSPNTTIDDFIRGIGLDKQKVEIPQWLIDYKCFDDEQQKELIDRSNQEIDELKAKIEQANIKLEENSKYKSILVTSGNELVSTVFEILEKLLVCDLSSFKDEKREDFLIPKENITFVGEIKGVTSNVKYEHVTQVEVHRGKYLDKLKDENRKEDTKTLLIINPIRNKPLAEREPINEEQIDLSKKMGSLIITTESLLKIFEQFQNGEITCDKIISVFSARTGLLTMDAFYEDEEKVDNSVYKI